MKKHISSFVVSFCAIAAAAIAAPADKDTITSKERAAWQAFKEKRADDFKKLVSPKVVAVYAEGIYDLQKELDQMSKTDMRSFSLSDMNVIMTDANTVIVTYIARVEGTADGDDMSGDYNCGSIWQRKAGEWRAIFHSDMLKQQAAAAAPAAMTQ